MIFNDHSNLAGAHAFLSASKYHWINYDDDRFVEVFRNQMAAQRGTELHEFAKRAVELGIRLPRNRQTLNLYVNDAIGYRMRVEQVLFYSAHCFGTADAISFRNNKLRIHDLKTGVNQASMKQLMVYAALFCLEYNLKPEKIEIELRIYQNDDIQVDRPATDDINFIMERIVYFDKAIKKLITEEA